MSYSLRNLVEQKWSHLCFLYLTRLVKKCMKKHLVKKLHIFSQSFLRFYISRNAPKSEHHNQKLSKMEIEERKFQFV